MKNEINYTHWRDIHQQPIYEGYFVTKGQLVGEVCWDEDRKEWVVAYNPPDFCTSLDDAWKIIHASAVESFRAKFRNESIWPEIEVKDYVINFNNPPTP